MTPIEHWGATGVQLLRSLPLNQLVGLAVVAASIQTEVMLRMAGGGQEVPALLDAKSAAQIIGPWCTAKWLYNHVNDLPPGCIHRVGRRVLFVGPKLRDWAVTVPKCHRLAAVR